MTIDQAIAELRLRRDEEADAARDGTWQAFAAMKRRWAIRRRQRHNMSRSQMRYWLDKAELAIDRVEAA